MLELLEDRTLPSNYTAATVSQLIADINSSNQQGGANTITLVAGTTFSLTAKNNPTGIATGLPFITAKDNLTIVGNGDTIERSAAAGTPAFRLFDVAAGASLTLQNLTLQGGLAFGAGASAEGGAIYSQGTLDLNGVTVQNNTAQGSNGYIGQAGWSAAGGGIYSGGVLTLEGGTTIQNNQAIGGQGGHGGLSSVAGAHGPGGAGGDALGGGLYVAGGTVTVTAATLTNDTVQAGQGGQGIRKELGGNGGNGLGGGIYISAGTVTLRNDHVTHNSAQRGVGGSGKPRGGPGLGEGGGLFIDSTAAVYLDAFTQTHVSTNIASTSDPNIHGPWKPA
jgi:hypothetical protein